MHFNFCCCDNSLAIADIHGLKGKTESQKVSSVLSIWNIQCSQPLRIYQIVFSWIFQVNVIVKLHTVRFANPSRIFIMPNLLIQKKTDCYPGLVDSKHCCCDLCSSTPDNILKSRFPLYSYLIHFVSVDIIWLSPRHLTNKCPDHVAI